jgi:hypothetical protein
MRTEGVLFCMSVRQVCECCTEIALLFKITMRKCLSYMVVMFFFSLYHFLFNT